MRDEITISKAELEKMIESAVEEKLAPRLASLEARLEQARTRMEQRGVSQRVTLVVVSGDFERAAAAFIIATGAAAMGMESIIFFSFWGIPLLRQKAHYRGKSLAEKMLSWFLPTGVGSLPTSRMNMLGMGPAFFKNLMRRHGVETLPSMLKLAEDLGVRLVVCQMSMGLLGIRADELRPSVELGGVATYLEAASDSRVTLFI